MNKGENPATWMLNVLSEEIMVKGENGEDEPLDFSDAWNASSNCVDLQRRLVEAAESQDEAMEIKYESEFAVPWYRRDSLMAQRLVTIYWRCPAYNLSRMVRKISFGKCPHSFNWNSRVAFMLPLPPGAIDDHRTAAVKRVYPHT